MKPEIETDIAIIGGGVAGLWLLNQLRQLGFSVILLESNSLGGEQTHKAQGIIHGGMKYALQGMLTQSATAVSAMPQIWNACFQGSGDIDLTRVPILSTVHHLWSTQSLGSKLAGFFAGLAFAGTVTPIEKEAYPALF